MISRYYKYGITWEQMEAVKVGDEIQLERDGKVAVLALISPLREGERVVQRSVVVSTEDRQQKLLLVSRDSDEPKLVNF